MKLFSETLPFYKANFHTHTTESDGLMTPAESMALYRAAGYDVLAITHHRRVTVPGDIPDGLLTVPGIELDFTLPDQVCHIVGLGMAPEIAAQWRPQGAPQQAVDDVLRLGGCAILAHPAWSLNTPAFIASLRGLCGVEIWNSVSAPPHNADRADSSSLLDVAWSTGCPAMPVFANDDAHFYDCDAAVAATMVQADGLTVPAILDALRAGRFYATLGPRILQIEQTGAEIAVRCSEVVRVTFYSNRPWVAGRSRVGTRLTESVYRIQPGDRFVRVEIADSQGRRAWSAPMPVRPDPA